MKKNIIKTISVVMILLLGIQINGRALAKVTQQDIKDLQSEQQEKKQNNGKLEEQKKEVTTQKNEALKQVEKLSDEISQYEYQIDELDNKLTTLNDKITTQEEELKNKQKEFEKHNELYEARLLAIYEQGETSYLELILASDSITEMVSNYYLVSELAKNDNEMLEKIKKQQQEIEKAKNELEANKKEVTTAKAEKESVALELKSSKTKKDQEVSKLSGKEKEIQKQMDEYNRASKEIEKEIRDLQKKLEEQNKIPKPSTSSGSSSSGGGSYVAPTKGALQKPVRGGIVSATWYYPSGNFHGAIDYAVPRGTPVYAAADGIVMRTGNLEYGYGTHVIIYHPQIGLYTWYGHGTINSFSVSVGQKVSRGQQIMLSGNTGNSTGPHLHFEARTKLNSTSSRVYPPNYY